jgi:hypothetical protein
LLSSRVFCAIFAVKALFFFRVEALHNGDNLSKRIKILGRLDKSKPKLKLRPWFPSQPTFGERLIGTILGINLELGWHKYFLLR